MFRILLSLLFLITATNAMAQHAAIIPVKTTEKQDDPQIDYKQIGAPMPPLRLFLYHDTIAKKQNPSALKENDSLTTHRNHKKMKKQHNNVREFEHKQFITNKDLDNGANQFIMIFNPTFSHCEDETVMLEKNISLFNKSKLLLMATSQMKLYLSDFVHLLRVDEYPAIYVGTDSSGFVNNVFMYRTLPQLNIYNGDHKLLKIYTGEVSIDSLKQYIE